MTDREFVLDAMRSIGQSRASNLRTAAKNMSETEIIDQENWIPGFKHVDYTKAPQMTPVSYKGQIYLLLQPHNAATWPDMYPPDSPTLWGLAHTKNPAKAKEFVASHGTSGLYYPGECCTDPQYSDPKQVFVCREQTSYRPSEYMAAWDKVTPETSIEENQNRSD